MKADLSGEASGVAAEGVGELEQHRQQGAVDGGEVPQGLAVLRQGGRRHLGGEVEEQAAEQVVLKDAGCLAE